MSSQSTRQRLIWGLLAGLALGSWAASARADRPIVHVVRPGETLASIADLYYGDPQRESILVTENGLATDGGSAIVVGLRLRIPTVGYHRVEQGETWPELAREYYGDSRRAFVLMEANGGHPGRQPDAGAELLIPYPLRHVAGAHETVRQVAQTYYSDRREASAVRRFNRLPRIRLERGEIVLVPLAGLKLSEAGRKLVEERTGKEREGGDVRAHQAEIDAKLPALRQHVRQGRYTEAVATGNRLVGSGDLKGSQIVTIQRELATAYVALGRQDLAVRAFQQALQHQPYLELDTSRTSPKVLRAFAEAKRTRKSGAEEGGEGETQ